MRRAILCCTIVLVSLAWAVAPSPRAGADHAATKPAGPKPPYPPSPVIAGFEWHWQTRTSAARGSDQWPPTWADDGHLYLTWGDGGGFGGTNSKGRASLGVARIEGTPPKWKGVNIWGGVKPLSKQKPIPGKGRPLCIDGTIYVWAVKQDKWDFTRIAKSADHGKTWAVGAFILEKPLSRMFPIQFGKDYAGARDDYVYGYFANDGAKELCLTRVDKNKLEDRKAYEFFAGRDGKGRPTWTSDIKRRRPAFTDANGVGWGAQCVYHPVLKRYLLTAFHDKKGGWGVFDAPEPWGPWTTAAYYEKWKDDKWKFCFSFPRKWMSGDGLTMWMIHSGWPEYDRYCHIKCALKLRGRR